MQDYPCETELVICNDLPSQTLVFDHPRVTVVNLPARCANLGEKRNVTASHAKGKWLMTWGDDDIHLPWRIGRLVKHMEAQNLDFCLEGSHFVLDHLGLHRKEYSTGGAHMVKRSLFEQLGGISPLSSGEDVEFNERVRAALGELPECHEPPAFIYRWHSDRPHVSGLKGDHYKVFGELIDSLIAAGKEPQGTIHLQPQWRQSWINIASSSNL